MGYTVFMSAIGLCGPTTWIKTGVGCITKWAADGSRDLGLLTLVRVTFTFLVEKEPELVWELQQYQLDTFGLAFMHSTGSETNSWRGAT